MDEEATGRHAKTVFRDKATGRRRDLTKENEKKEEQEAEQRVLEEKYQKWNKCVFVSMRRCKGLSSFRGIVQLKEREQRLKEATEVVQEPLARYEGNERLEEHLKGQLMKEDPMMQYIYKKKQKKTKAPSELSSAESS